MSIRKEFLFIAALLTLSIASAKQPKYEVITSTVPISSFGNITRMAIASEKLGGNVIVDVWTTAEYEGDSEKRYPVVYAHDGQNLFDVSFTFAGVPWGVDKACAQLASDPDFVTPIVVGINNRGAEGLRPNDYFPENALDYISPDQMENTFIYDTCNDIFLGNEEAAFVAEELKPLIDSLYNTASGMSTTFTMGSSMGALASMYLLCEYPQIFGGAACMSTHWIGSLNLNPDYSMNDDEVCANAILQYLSEHIPSDGLHRLYLDQGTEGWDAGYLKYESTAREIVRDKGYTEENGKLYTYDAKGAGHNEWYWQQRVILPLKFLLSKSAIESAGVIERYDDSYTEAKEFIYDIGGAVYPNYERDNLPNGLYIIKGEKVIKGR
ncbi:MAG: esterase family protein [Muribaculaceae bacterium]|nr:esterase family protein [Muribaculaceae bacterium]